MEEKLPQNEYNEAYYTLKKELFEMKTNAFDKTFGPKFVATFKKEEEKANKFFTLEVKKLNTKFLRTKGIKRVSPTKL